MTKEKMSLPKSNVQCVSTEWSDVYLFCCSIVMKFYIPYLDLIEYNKNHQHKTQLNSKFR